jgi:hypothetical protein
MDLLLAVQNHGLQVPEGCQDRHLTIATEDKHYREK